MGEGEQAGDASGAEEGEELVDDPAARREVQRVLRWLHARAEGAEAQTEVLMRAVAAMRRAGRVWRRWRRW